MTRVSRSGPAGRWSRLAARQRQLLRLPWRVLAVLATGWRRSLQLRVVVTICALSTGVVVLVGVAVLDQVTRGLMQDKLHAALAELSAGVSKAQSQFAAVDSPDPASFEQVAYQLVAELATSGSSSGLFNVALLTGTANGSVTGDVDVASVPARLRAAVTASRGREAYVYTTLQYAGGRTEPGLVVGAPVGYANTVSYQLYYLFPLRQETQTISLVRGTLLFAGLALVALIGAVAVLVARQVTSPVRAAARTAERLAAGRLDQRMTVRGSDDLARLAVSFNKMASRLQRHINRLEDLSRMQRRFVADVSHELRTPLTTVRMAADVLHQRRVDFPPEVARAAELLQNELDRFEALLTDLLEISRHDAGAVELEAETTEVGRFLRRVMDGIEPLARRRGSLLHLDLPAGPVHAEMDRRRMERVLRNLLANAVEHGEGLPIEVTVRADAETVAIGVRDHGVGLRADEASSVFNRFWRADPSRARTTGGTGLGLAISLEDVRLHGGWLRAWGEPGQGCLFQVTLPRRAGGQLPGPPPALAPADPALLASGPRLGG